MSHVDYDLLGQRVRNPPSKKNSISRRSLGILEIEIRGKNG